MYQSQRKQINAHVDALWRKVEEIHNAYDLCVYQGKYQGLGTMKADAVYMKKELAHFMAQLDKVIQVFE